MEKGRMKEIQRMTGLAFLVALVVVLQLVATLISRAAVLPFNLTLTLVPIIVGALLYGVSGGAILGFAFGVIVMIFGFTGFDPSCAILIQTNPFTFVFLCLLKGTAAGAAAGVLASVLKHKKLAAAFAAAAAAPVVNTGIFLLGMRLFYYDLMVDWAGAQGQSILYYMIFALCGINFVIEFVLNIALAPIDVRIVNAVSGRKRQ